MEKHMILDIYWWLVDLPYYVKASWILSTRGEIDNLKQGEIQPMWGEIDTHSDSTLLDISTFCGDLYKKINIICSTTGRGIGTLLSFSVCILSLCMI